ncbi:gliding motility lipoprotein GldB [Ascidiimonas sp. W6]|uniref:gliding motility lipoprotein GldB n=1 Tax=Ascidiimonas meishanensis TaxID=3128903 RepID=UPI0030ED0304
MNRATLPIFVNKFEEMRILKSILLCSIFFIWSCKDDSKITKEIEAIEVDVNVKRFDLDFANTTIETLPNIKSEYPYLFPVHFQDSIWINKIRDTLQLELNQAVKKEFNDFKNMENDFEKLFKHLRYYTPELSIPDIVTLTSYVDYRRKMIYADSLLLISLDTYLGENHKFYEGIQYYIRKNFKREQIIPDAAVAISKELLPPPSSRSFISQIIHHGKQLYFMDLVIPWVEDYRKIGYTKEEFQWSQVNEAEIWRYFVDRKLLFSTDQKLRARFVDPAPFSKFYLELDAESPGEIGRFIGWQIVKSYMENNDVSLQEMFIEPEEKLFSKSGFKPKKNG